MQIQVIFVIFCIILDSLPCRAAIDEKWKKFKTKKKRKFKSKDEESWRKKVFAENYKFIDEHNKLYEKGEVTFALDVNDYADVSLDEFVKSFTILPPPVRRKSHRKYHLRTSFLLTSSQNDIPESVDWRAQGYVTPVKKQGICGACHAFSAAGAVEAQHFKKTGQLLSLSPQNLIDCTYEDPYDNLRCKGGYLDTCFKYIQNNGILTEQEYPYKGVNGTCKPIASKTNITISGYVNIAAGSDEDLIAALATVGPVPALINATLKTLQFYKSGVYADPECSPDTVTHAILIVGYTECCWIIKNTWGRTWGENGYMRLSRETKNMCGISSWATYPLM